jgi:hypothetical protein
LRNFKRSISKKGPAQASLSPIELPSSRMALSLNDAFGGPLIDSLTTFGHRLLDWIRESGDVGI